MDDLLFFDHADEFTIIERRLPHWVQPGVVCFITFRTNDSMPKNVLIRWHREREQWLRKNGINPVASDWRRQLAKLQRGQQIEFHRTFSDRWHDELDSGHGECVLRNADLATIVGDSLLFSVGEKYELTDFVVMPNHVHLLAAFSDEQGMLAQCRSWKTFTATRINRALNRTGRFWQQDGFDHLVRSEEEFRHYQRYIASNPQKSKLRVGGFFHFADRQK
jgi:putative transposase